MRKPEDHSRAEAHAQALYDDFMTSMITVYTEWLDKWYSEDDNQTAAC